MRMVWLIVGILVFLMGILWTLQGLDLVGGSPMSGVTLWAIIGPIVAVVGLIVAGVNMRKKSAGA